MWLWGPAFLNSRLQITADKEYYRPFFFLHIKPTMFQDNIASVATLSTIISVDISLLHVHYFEHY